MKPPRLRGRALVAARAAAENPATAALLSDIFKKSLHLDRIAELPPSARLPLPIDATPLRAKSAPRELEDAGLPPPRRSEWPRTAREIGEAFSSRKVDPRAIAERALRAANRLASNRVLNVLCGTDEARTQREANEAAERLARGERRGPLDGIPVLIKDEIDVRGLATRVGSRCEPDEPRAEDSTVVARLARAGAVFVGKTVMTEYGMSPLGQNPAFPMPHNALHAERVPGGSSSGSGVGVALGVVPCALGTDGGGSVRIPACLNGVFGIKPTFGRVSRAGSLQGSVGHIGPLGASSEDLAWVLDAIASEPDPLDPLTAAALPPPKAGFGSRLGAGVKGLTIGVAESEWSDASPVVASKGREALACLERAGAKIVKVAMPLGRVAAPIGYVTIGCESLALNAHHRRDRRALLSDDLRLSYAVLAGISSTDYLDAQRLRAALRAEVAKLLVEVDVLALPTTATTAPPLPVQDRGASFADTEAIDAMCRFNFLGNLTGLPAGTAPVGADEEGLPVGLQIVGDAWDEHVVLGVMAELERVGAAAVPKPKAAMDLLG